MRAILSAAFDMWRQLVAQRKCEGRMCSQAIAKRGISHVSRCVRRWREYAGEVARRKGVARRVVLRMRCGVGSLF